MSSEMKHRLPSIARGRKGRKSLGDCLVEALWKTDDQVDWPRLSFAELRAAASARRLQDVTSGAVRGQVYTRPDIFERAPADGSGVLRWRLTRAAKKLGGGER
jgi:hypothetical protein